MAEQTPAERRHALTFNAITRTLNAANRYVPLTVREDTARAVLAALDADAPAVPPVVAADSPAGPDGQSGTPDQWETGSSHCTGCGGSGLRGDQTYRARTLGDVERSAIYEAGRKDGMAGADEQAAVRHASGRLLGLADAEALIRKARHKAMVVDPLAPAPSPAGDSQPGGTS